MSNEHFGFGNTPPPAFTPPPQVARAAAWAQHAAASQASAEQLALPHQLVTLTVDPSYRSSIGVPDRFNQMHYIAPGEKVELDLTLSHIENIIEKSSEDHGRYQPGTCRPELVGQLLPQSPLRIVDGIIGRAESQPQLDAREAELEARERRLAERESEFAKRSYAAAANNEAAKA